MSDRKPLARLPRHLPGRWAVLAVACGCSLGAGEGTVQGTVSAPFCELQDAPYDLEPSFFAAAEAAEGLLEVRVQRGSDLESLSDGLTLLVLDPVDIRQNRLGEAIPIRATFDHPVRMSFYMNETCPISRTDNPVNYEGVEGEITFTSIYAPALGEDSVETAATFSDAVFVDPRSPAERSARLDGTFRFLFSRGRPAQRFP